jgi:very-short-patch-repair endonuclease
MQKTPGLESSGRCEADREPAATRAEPFGLTERVLALELRSPAQCGAFFRAAEASWFRAQLVSCGGRWCGMPATALTPGLLSGPAPSGCAKDRMGSSEQPDGAELRLSELAGRQRGVFTRAQAIDVGVSVGMLARRIDCGLWLRVLPRVYRMASVPASWSQRLWAGCLWAGAIVSHHTAARLYGLEGVHDRGRAPIQLTARCRTMYVAPGYVVHTTRHLERKDHRVWDGIPVTSLSRTLVDLAPLLDDRQLGLALDSGLALFTSIDPAYLAREVARLRAFGRRTANALVKLLAARAPDALDLDSALERRFSAVLRRARLPRPREHYEVVDSGRRLAEVDFAYPRARLAIQLHGAAIHRRYSVWQRDQAQSSDLAAAGWRVLNVTGAQLDSGEAEVVDRVERALAVTQRVREGDEGLAAAPSGAGRGGGVGDPSDRGPLRHQPLAVAPGSDVAQFGQQQSSVECHRA